MHTVTDSCDLLSVYMHTATPRQVGLSLRGQELTRERGESIPVSFQTLTVAPQVAAWLEQALPESETARALANDMRAFVQALAVSLNASMSDPGSPLLVRRVNAEGVSEAWFSRAWIYGRLESDLPWDEPELYGSEHPDLYVYNPNSNPVVRST